MKANEILSLPLELLYGKKKVEFFPVLTSFLNGLSFLKGACIQIVANHRFDADKFDPSDVEY